MKFHFEAYELLLRHPFRITRGSRTHAHTVIVDLEHDDVVGIGETSPIMRYGETVDSVLAWFAEHPPQAKDPFDREELLAGVPPAARCALDVSIHDWIGKKLGLPLWQYLGLEPSNTLTTSYTLGIDSPEKNA